MGSGTLNIQVPSGTFCDLKRGDGSYYLSIAPPSTLCRKPITTGKSTDLKWVFSGDALLKAPIALNMRIEVSLLQSKGSSGVPLGQCFVPLDELGAGQGIDSEYSIASESGKKLVSFQFKVSWKEGSMPPPTITPEQLRHAQESRNQGGGGGSGAAAVELPDPAGKEFSLHVKFHKAKNLQSLSSSELYNPFGLIKALDESAKTSTVKCTNNPILDEELVLHFKDTKGDFWRQALAIKMVSDHGLLPNATIGGIQLELGNIYQSSVSHQMRKKWFVLFESLTDGSIMGYLQSTVTILDTHNDEMPPDDDDDEETDEDEEDEMISNLVMGPNASFEEIFMHVDIVQARDIPKMNLMGHADPYTKLVFGKTSAETSYVRNQANPQWGANLTLPLQLPFLTSSLNLQLWNYSRFTRDSIIGSRVYDLQRLVNDKTGLPDISGRWIPLYGHPRSSNAMFHRFFRKMAIGRAKGVDYRGALLLRGVGARTNKPPVLPPITTNFVKVMLRVDLMHLSLLSRGGSYRIQVSLGRESVSTSKLHAKLMIQATRDFAIPLDTTLSLTTDVPTVLEDQVFKWPEPFDEIEHNLQREEYMWEQLPSVVIHVLAGSTLPFGDEEPIAALVIPTRRLFASEARSLYFNKPMRVMRDPETLSEGKSLSNPIIQCCVTLAVTESDPPSFAFVPTIEATPVINISPTTATKEPGTYLLECFVFQARNLPPADSNGLADPFLQLHWSNGSIKTHRKAMTLNPLFYEFVVLLAELKLPLPGVVIEIWDRNAIGSNKLMAKTLISWEKVQKGLLLEPTWITGFKDGVGRPVPQKCEVLMQFALHHAPDVRSLAQRPHKVRMYDRTGSEDSYFALPIPMHLQLPLACYEFTIELIGLRRMKATRLGRLRKPALELRIGPYLSETQPVIGSSNPDFGLKLTWTLVLPQNKEWMPPLEAIVVEHRAGPKNLVGAASLALSDPLFDPSQREARLAATDKLVCDRINALYRWLDSEGDAESTTVGSEPDGENGTTEGGRLTTAVSVNGEMLDDSVVIVLDEQIEDAMEANSTAAALMEFPPKEQGNEGEEVRASSLASSEADEMFWYDRFDVDEEGYARSSQLPVETRERVLRLGHLSKYARGLNARQTTCEDFFGPFDDEISPITLYRGAGKRRRMCGEAQMSIVFQQVSAYTMPSRLNKLYMLWGGDNPAGADLVSAPNDNRPSTSFTARIYLIGCSDLPAMSKGLFGKSSDPYVRLTLSNGGDPKGGGSSLGSVKLNCREQIRYQTLNPDYYFMRELKGTLPAHGILSVRLYDKRRLGSDVVMGETLIDLEQRYYSRRGYRAPAIVHDATGGSRIHGVDCFGLTHYGSYTERRLLRNKAGSMTGSIELWVDVFDDNTPIPRPLSIAPPPSVPLELRVTVWQARDVELVATGFDNKAMTDIYIRCWIDGVEHLRQSTDVHYHSLDGTGTFNWRMKFPLVFEARSNKVYGDPLLEQGKLREVGESGGASSTAEGSGGFFNAKKEAVRYPPVLHAQIFDNSVLPGLDSYIGEATLQLTQLKPTTTRRPVSPWYVRARHCLSETCFICIILYRILIIPLLFLRFLCGVMIPVKWCGGILRCLCCGSLGICCIQDKEEKRQRLAERQRLGKLELERERKALRKAVRKEVKKRMKPLLESGEYNEVQLARMERRLEHEARKRQMINVFEAFSPKRQRKSDKQKADAAYGAKRGTKKSEGLKDDENDDPPVLVDVPKCWYACRGPDGGLRVGDIQLSFELVRADALFSNPQLLAGKGRSEPQQLPEPTRPKNSYFWLSNPWKAAVVLLWNQYKWYLFIILILALLVWLFFVTVTLFFQALVQSFTRRLVLT